LTRINFQRTYFLGEEYESIRDRAVVVLDKYLKYPELYSFDDLGKSVTFSTERLIPPSTGKRPRVILLFSNPHPHSVYQGMFLSPNTKGRENLFWSTMINAGWFTIPEDINSPEELADFCLNAKDEGPFELVFYCYYAFPTNYPEEIATIFGDKYFRQVIEPEANKELRDMIKETQVQAVVTFNKGVFNLVSSAHLDNYVNRLIEGELIKSQITDIDRDLPIFLTYPTGWRYKKRYKELRKASLELIRKAIFLSVRQV